MPVPVPTGVKARRDASESPTIVGVGASAGGLEAFSQLLGALSPDSPFAFVFVQHLSPQHESALAELLRSRSPFPVVQAEEGAIVEPRHVYVIPPNAQMEVADGRLHLLARPLDRSQFTPIDHFLQSLGRFAQNRAIGIILSGTASDGAAGIREIKSAGGITIAQRPSTAKYDGMPRAAIGTGMVDLILSPSEIAEHLHQIQAHPYLEPPTSQAQTVVPTDVQMADIFTMLRRVSGIDFRHYKPPTVRRRLLRRMALQRSTDMDRYIQLLRQDSGEITSLYHDLLIHVTRFFRDPDSFTTLASQVLTEIVHERPEDEPIRIWVPGCATGEEAYSVAIALMEVLGDQASSRRVQIFATDVSENAVEQARTGMYPLSITSDVSPERLRRFFTRSDGGYKINKNLRDACVFARHDLARDPPFSRLDLVICRNVLIYLDAAVQKRLISVFHYALRNRGFLMLGPAETAGAQMLFTMVDKRWRIYRRAAVDIGMPVGFPERAVVAPPAHAVREPSRPEGRSVQDEANRVLLRRYGPVGVIIDSNQQVVQFRGSTGPFLEPPTGEPSMNLLKMAREGLLFPLRAAIQLARRRHKPVRREGVRVRRDKDWLTVTLEVLPLGPTVSGHYLVTFEDTPTRKSARRVKAVPVASRKRESDERVAGLTRELAASREYLQSIIQELEAANEELQSANEEILSSNEELQSTNEELDTAKEELQSTNEELNTLNEELHSRNEELSRVNSDLTNLLATVDITILIVGDDMGIRRFTPMAERVLNLIPGDINRPVGQIKTNLVDCDLEAVTRETVETMMPREREVQDKQGKWYSLRIRPYKNVDNRIDGAVLTLMDIATVKRYEQQLEQSKDQLQGVLALAGDPMVLIDEDRRIILGNQAFGQMVAKPLDKLPGLRLADLGRGAWQAPEMLALLEQAERNTGTPHAATLPWPSAGDERALPVRAIRLAPNGSSPLTALSIKDVDYATQ